MDLTDTQAAWLAGLYEGEGCLNQDKRSGHWRFSIAMTDEDVINKAAKMVGARVGKPYRHPNPDYKPVYRFAVYSQDLISEILSALEPHLGERRMSKVSEFRTWLENSKYHYCRKGLHKMEETRTSSGSTTRCHLCKMEYQREYRARNKEK